MDVLSDVYFTLLWWCEDAIFASYLPSFQILQKAKREVFVIIIGLFCINVMTGNMFILLTLNFYVAMRQANQITAKSCEPCLLILSRI